MSVKRMTRRDLLKLSVIGVTGAVLAACQPKVVEKIVKETVIVEQEKEKVVEKTVVVEKQVEVPKEVTKVVEKVVTVAAPAGEKKIVRVTRCGWIEEMTAIDTAVVQYNNLPERAEDKVEIVLDPAGKMASDPAAIDMVKSGTLMWGGHTCYTPFIDAATSGGGGFIDPIEPYLDKSRYADAAKRIRAEMFKSVWDECSWDGKLHFMPLATDVVAWMYRKDYLEAVGYKEAPKNWDEMLDAAIKVKEKFAKEEVFGFHINATAWYRGLAAMHQAFSPSEKLFFTEGPLKGVVNITDEGFIKAVDTVTKFMKAGVVPQGWEKWDYPVTWKMGKLAMALNQHSMATWGADIWGYNNLGVAPLPKAAGLEKAGSMFWSSCAVLYHGAKYPQEWVDFLVWMMDPENPVQNTGATRSGWITPFRSAIQKYYPADDVTKSWAHGVAAALEGSTCPPHTKYYMMMLGPVTSHLVPLWSGEAKDAAAEMAVAKAELETQIAESEKKK